MKFLEAVKEFQKLEENKGKIVMARCGVFIVAVGKDAVFLNKILHLNVVCIKPGICKVGIPVTYTLKYADKLESMGYGYVIYDYDYDYQNKKFQRKYSFEGKENTESEKNIGCKNCKYCKKHENLDNVDIFDILKKREEERTKKKGTSKDE